MENVRATLGAALKPLPPAWEAVIVQEPAPVSVTSATLTVQLPDAAKLTVRPEEAVALTVKGGSPTVLSASGAKVIVWLFPAGRQNRQRARAARAVGGVRVPRRR